MSLNFLSPIFLYGLLGLSIPVLIHLLTKRQQKKVRFSAVYLLFQSQKRSIKRSAPNRLFLLFIRCLAIALLSLALANPIFSFSGPGADFPSEPSATVIVLDDSYSMAAQADESTLYAEAAAALESHLEEIPADSKYCLLLASSPPRLLENWSSDPDAGMRKLKASQVSFATTEIGPALKQAADLLDPMAEKKKRILLLTDRDRNGWDPETFPDSAERALYPVRVVDFSSLQSSPNRAAVESVEVRQEFLTNSRVLRVKTGVLNLAADGSTARLEVSLLTGDKNVSEAKVEVLDRVEQEFSYPLPGSDPVPGRIEISEDGLLVDNVRHFSYQPDQKIKVLVVDGDPKTVAHQSESFYLERALNPFSTTLSNIEPTVSTPEELAVRNLFDYSVLIFSNVDELPFDYILNLEKYVMAGGALFVALGDQVDPKYYNEKLGNLLPVKLKALQQVGRENEPFRLKFANTDHPVLRIFKDKTLEEMKGIRFHSLFSVELKPERKVRVAMRFRNEAPALIESDLGKGKVILFASSLDRDWNDFPIQPTFLPWIQRWVKYSARGLESILRQDLVVGEVFAPAFEVEEARYFVTTPGGRTAELFKTEAGLSFSETHRPGVYVLHRVPLEKARAAEDENTAFKIVSSLPENAEPVGAFTVNIDTAESAPGKISDAEIRTLLGEAPVEFFSGEDFRAPSGTSEGFPLTTPFFLGVAGLFLLEGWILRKE